MSEDQDSARVAYGQQVITAVAFIHKEVDGVQKVFLAKRAATKKFLPNFYEMPGGHIDFGEDIIAGLKREVREEIGEEITVGEVVDVFTYINEVKGAHAIEVVYACQFVGSGDDIKLNPADHSGSGWFAEDEIQAIRSELAPESQVKHDKEDDPEYLAIFKGFKLVQ